MCLQRNKWSGYLTKAKGVKFRTWGGGGGGAKKKSKNNEARKREKNKTFGVGKTSVRSATDWSEGRTGKKREMKKRTESVARTIIVGREH